ncbi:phosphopyruvate hydratase [Candidatus Shikimatogenerans silvanidophilus]|uniref:phosphopyruvate hydratase n=1 Tax=Candidatus Shikimatogenerans silvanidophilus TaxID=2782547 RepID=UPI001BA70668|nr:phosphopyruvate hydratase [Candidatus Shikimatogenerans silvanidophilus]
MSIIRDIKSRQILDSRGVPTIEVDIITNNGILGRASVPSGASTGSYEAIELRDGDKKEYLGKGVLKCISYINDIISEELIGISIFDQNLIDKRLNIIDGTKNKSRIGANTTLGISIAVAKAAAKYLKIPLYKYLGGINANTLPIPMVNIINGGSHSSTPISFQEFMIIPINFEKFSFAIRACSEIFQCLKKILIKKKLSTSVGDEGGFSPNLSNIKEILELILFAIEYAGYEPGVHIMLGLDCASSEFYNKKKRIYDYRKFEENGEQLNSIEQIDFLINLIKKYPIMSIEDGLSEDDWEGWKIITGKIGNYIQLVGDDLFVTNISKLKKGIYKNVANSILIKPNQIGTLSETIDVINYAKKYMYNTIISHRSGETEDSFISDLSVAFNTGQIKTGSLSRTDRMVKYNQLLRIEEELGINANY